MTLLLSQSATLLFPARVKNGLCQPQSKFFYNVWLNPYDNKSAKQHGISHPKPQRPSLPQPQIQVNDMMGLITEFLDTPHPQKMSMILSYFRANCYTSQVDATNVLTGHPPTIVHKCDDI